MQPEDFEIFRAEFKDEIRIYPPPPSGFENSILKAAKECGKSDPLDVDQKSILLDLFTAAQVESIRLKAENE